MKKVYSIPTVEVIQLSTVNAILEGSIDLGGGTTRPAANESRGEWGNVWSK
ncbi:MAG: hypothetical protein J6V23_02585 [Bacteroidaceae bacterium]|nr:hypothetical protein [Bacteroidaceae bacterium]